MSTPVIDENGIIYVGTIWASPCFYAFYPNGTMKWSYGTGNDIFSSPVIYTNDTVIFGDYNGYINALYCSNGTLRWRFHTNGFIDSSPALAEDGTVYCGSADGNLYALYPNNGTLKWSYQTGDWVGRGPAIANDGAIYFGSWDGYLYATFPNGTLKWKTSGYLAGTTPIIGQDGTVYVGNRYLSAVYPENGTVKWMFDPGTDRRIIGGNPAISSDGTIYFGTHIGETLGGEIIAVNQNGTERWRKMIAALWVDSSPAIAADGTVYIGSTNDLAHAGSEGYLHAFGPGEQKNFEITNPRLSHIYFFGKDLGVSKKGNTVVIGNDTIQLRINSEDEIESVSFLLGTTFHYFNQYTDTEPPFEWKMNKRYAMTPIFNHELNIVANYRGGCQWSETIQFWYFHLRKN